MYVHHVVTCTQAAQKKTMSTRKQTYIYSGGDRGREPGRTGGGRGTGDGRRKGRRRDLYDGGKRERNSKRQAFVFCYCLLPVKEMNPITFLDFHLTFSEA